MKFLSSMTIIGVSVGLGIVSSILSQEFLYPLLIDKGVNIGIIFLSLVFLILPIITTSITALKLTLKYQPKYPLLWIGLSQVLIYVIDSFIGADKAINDVCFRVSMGSEYWSCAAETLIKNSTILFLPFFITTALIFKSKIKIK